MALFDGRTAEERIEEAAFKATSEFINRREGLELDASVTDYAWGKAFPVAQSVARKAKSPLAEDVVRLHANKGYRRALDDWYGHVQERRDTRRAVIVETAHDAAAALFARYGSGDEVRGSIEDVFGAALPQARWLNDGDLAMDDDAFAQAVFEGVMSAADERASAIRAEANSAAQWAAARGSLHGASDDDWVIPGAERSAEPGATASPAADEQRAWGMAVDVASQAAAAAAESGEAPSAPAAEDLAMDAAAAAVEALPAGILDALGDDAQIDAALEGVARAGAAAGRGSAAPTDGSEESVPHPPAAGPHTTSAAPGRNPNAKDATAGAFARAARAAARAAPAAGRAAAGVGPKAAAAGRAAGRRAATERNRLSIARRAKQSIDTLLPEATGEPIDSALSDRIHAAARNAADEHNRKLGGPFSTQDAARIGDLTANSIMATWLAVGHLRKSGLADKATVAARTSAARLLNRYGLPKSVTEYIIDEAIKMASRGWAGGPGGRAGGTAGGTAGAGAGRADRQATFRGRPVADYYDVLQVSPKASSAVIDRAWRVLISQAHPDQGGDPERAVLLNEAHEVLLDADSRRAYDQENRF